MPNAMDNSFVLTKALEALEGEVEINSRFKQLPLLLYRARR